MPDYDTTMTSVAKILDGTLPAPPVFATAADIDNLTFDQALEVLRAARRACLMQLLAQEYHEHMGDDCGDYLEAATYNWTRLWDVYFTNDGDRDTLVMEVRKFLCLHVDYPLGGCDGEIRFSMIPEALLNTLQDQQEAAELKLQQEGR